MYDRTPPGEYFPTLKDFAAFYKGNFSTLSAAFAAAGEDDALDSNGWEGTLFAPLDSAFDAGAELLPELGRLRRQAAAEEEGTSQGDDDTERRLRVVLAYSQVRGLLG